MSWTNSADSHIHMKTAVGELNFDVWFDKDFTTPSNRRNIESHNHSLYEVHYIIGGTGTLIVEQREHPLKQNTWHIIGPGTYHAFRSNLHDPLRRSYWQFSCHMTNRRNDNANENESDKIQSVLSGLKYVCREDAARHIHWIDEIHQEIQTRRIGYYSRIRCLITLILLDLIREVEPDTRFKFSPPRLTKDDLRGSLIDNFFDQYSQPLTIGELASLLNLSAKQTNRVLLEQYQTTFKQKLLDTRIEVAKNLLATTELSVQEILERVGYSLHRSFVRVFKQKTGFAPVEYRRSMQTGKKG